MPVYLSEIDAKSYGQNDEECPARGDVYNAMPACIFVEASLIGQRILLAVSGDQCWYWAYRWLARRKHLSTRRPFGRKKRERRKLAESLQLGANAPSCGMREQHRSRRQRLAAAS